MHPGAWVKCTLDKESQSVYGYLVSKVPTLPDTWKVMIVQDDTEVLEPCYIKEASLKLLNQKQFISIKN